MRTWVDNPRVGRWKMTLIGRRDFLAGAIVAALTAPPCVRSAAGETGDLPQGAWSPVYSWPTVVIHQILLPNGKILSWNFEAGGNDIGQSTAFVVDIPP